MERLIEAAAAWRTSSTVTDALRDALVTAVADARAAGMSERAIAQAIGVSRVTVRAWLGKGWPS